MQRLILSIALITFSFFAHANHEKVNIPLNDSYIPIGFDDNDRVQLVVEGVFPNSCYRVSSYLSQVDPEKKEIRVTQQATRYSDMDCLQIIVPFSQVVNVGIIPAGNYKVIDGVTGQTIGMMPVTRATTAAADNYLYAPINDAYITSDGPTPTTLVLMGSFLDKCSEFEEVKVSVDKKTIIVQPITRRTNTSFCPSEKISFLKRVDLKEKIRGIYLLHVRSLNGQAINKLVEII